MINVSVVSYINAAPFKYGLQHYLDMNTFTLHIDTPDVCAKKLLNNEIDIGLVPVAIIPKLKEAYLVSEYCIGAVGAVNSVKLYSNVELNAIKTIVLDAESNTSNKLCQILCKHYWQIAPDFVTHIDKETKETARVIIGDRALVANGKYAFEYDLAQAWYDYKRQPFVFAAWVANKKIPQNTLLAFNNALQKGLVSLDSVVNQLGIENPHLPVRNYLTTNIHYYLNSPLQPIIDAFLSL